MELSPMVWAFLRQSLWSVVNERRHGRGRPHPRPRRGREDRYRPDRSRIRKSDKGQDHAWFASFAPARAPEVVVVVLVERGGKGGQVAAPIARQDSESNLPREGGLGGVGGLDPDGRRRSTAPAERGLDYPRGGPCPGRHERRDPREPARRTRGGRRVVAPACLGRRGSGRRSWSCGESRLSQARRGWLQPFTWPGWPRS